LNWGGLILIILATLIDIIRGSEYAPADRFATAREPNQEPFGQGRTFDLTNLTKKNVIQWLSISQTCGGAARNV
jgi:hypothetical protein